MDHDRFAIVRIPGDGAPPTLLGELEDPETTAQVLERIDRARSSEIRQLVDAVRQTASRVRPQMGG